MKFDKFSNVHFSKKFLQEVFRSMFQAVWSLLVPVCSDTFSVVPYSWTLVAGLQSEWEKVSNVQFPEKILQELFEDLT